MSPEKNVENLPPQCVLDITKLDTIEKTVLATATKVDELVSMTGPVVDVRTRMKVVEGTVKTHGKDIEVLQKSINGIVVKLGVILTPIAAGIGALVAKLL
jgi:hypothetical protein